MQRKEYSKREAALDDKNISFVLSQKCKKSRNVDYRSYKCRGNCADNFASISDAFKVVKNIRLSIWIDPETMDFNFSANNASGLDVRKAAFLRAIQTMTFNSISDESLIIYVIAGVTVCKNFYFRATGLKKSCLIVELHIFCVKKMMSKI